MIFNIFSQALQGKHDTLLQRIDELDQECEELREKVMDLEGEKDDFDENLQETKNQSENLTKELAAKQVRIFTCDVINFYDVDYGRLRPFSCFCFDFVLILYFTIL